MLGSHAPSAHNSLGSHPLPQRGFTGGEVRLAFEVKDARVRLELLGTLFAFCRWVGGAAGKGCLVAQKCMHNQVQSGMGTVVEAQAQPCCPPTPPCRTHESHVPRVVGIDASELESSAALYSSKHVSAAAAAAVALLGHAADVVQAMH